jgi:hypothetical protein
MRNERRKYNFDKNIKSWFLWERECEKWMVMSQWNKMIAVEY